MDILVFVTILILSFKALENLLKGFGKAQAANRDPNLIYDPQSGKYIRRLPVYAQQRGNRR